MLDHPVIVVVFLVLAVGVSFAAVSCDSKARVRECAVFCEGHGGVQSCTASFGVECRDGKSQKARDVHNTTVYPVSVR